MSTPESLSDAERLSSDISRIRELLTYHDAKRGIAALDRLVATLGRAATVAENLHGMIDRETWRASGGDDMQGHYEGDYHAEQIQREIETWKAVANV